MITRRKLKRIPKTDLHVHMGGSIRLSTLIDLAGESSVELPSYTVSGLRRTAFKKNYRSLEEYLEVFRYCGSVMQKYENLDRIAYELAVDNQNEGVRYIEVRFAPQRYAGGEMLLPEVFEAVDRGLSRAKKEFNDREPVLTGEEPPFEYGIIACAMRHFTRDSSLYFKRLYDVHRFSSAEQIYGLASIELANAAAHAKNRQNLQVVGIDLAGAEKGYPPIAHREAYEIAGRNFLHKTVHAGEAFGPESIYQAVTELGADRIGHGKSLFNPQAISDPEIVDKELYISDLVQFIADRRITVEVCLSSNMQTDPGIRDLKDHPFRLMLENRLSCTLCTDNRTVSDTTVTDEYMKAMKFFDISDAQLKNLVAYGFKRSFYPGTYRQKRDYVKKCLDYFETITTG